jgi:hypothetical protein
MLSVLMILLAAALPLRGALRHIIRTAPLRPPAPRAARARPAMVPTPRRTGPRFLMRKPVEKLRGRENMMAAFIGQPAGSAATPCCARSPLSNLPCKNSMAHSLMSRKSASIGSRRCRDATMRKRHQQASEQPGDRERPNSGIGRFTRSPRRRGREASAAARA